MSATKASLEKFVTYCQQYIKGDEKGEAQIFLDRFFQAFGHEGALEAGAIYEERIKKVSKAGRTGFADLVWKPRVLIEMKKRGEVLTRHWRQTFDYWTYLVPNRPRYVIICNFDEFWIYDFNLQVDTPVDIVRLEELPERLSAFTFMELSNRTPVFQNNQVEVTERAAKRMGLLFKTLQQRGKKKNLFDDMTAQRFVLQCVLAMFAEDRQLLPRDLFLTCIEDCVNGGSSYDILGGLFHAMNNPQTIPAGRYEGVEYFNGGLFSIIQPLELTKEELNILESCGKENWSKVRPSIFGNIFEGAVGGEENQAKRHQYGIHFTSDADILAIVKPTITQYWDERIEQANSIKELQALQLELQSYQVLDPACGSGNFLYLAYQELKQIEQDLLTKIASQGRGKNHQQQISFVTPLQFYGIDINAFAVELARVTLTIARKVAIDNLNLNEPALPLDSLDKNIICADSLFTEWPKANAIIGNPPFLGGKKLRSLLGDQYIAKLTEVFPAVKGQPDFCVFWFRKAHDHLRKNDRAGLVGTNSITQISSRIASLDYIVENGGFIHNAISTQPWSGEANVHVSIVNWLKTPPAQLFLDDDLVDFISTSLKTDISVTTAQVLQANKNYSFESCQLAGKGFIISAQEAEAWMKKSKKNQLVLKPMLDGKSLINLYGEKDWVIDFNDLSLEEASNYKLPFARVKEKVKPERDKNKEKSRRENWWLFGRSRPNMRQALRGLSCYFAIPKIVKYIMFQPVDIAILPCEANMVIACDDFYILGILNSQIHRLWVEAQRSTLEDRTRYTNTTCFETFPFPQIVTKKLVTQIRQQMTKLHQYRMAQMQEKQWGITDLYNEFWQEPQSKLSKFHKKLDELVMLAYEFTEDDDCLEKLWLLNQELANKEVAGENIIGPWSPSGS
jgi:SAM-dependent methyltransferase